MQNIADEAPGCSLTLVGLSFPFSRGYEVEQVDGRNDAKHHLPLTGGAIGVIYMETERGDLGGTHVKYLPTWF